MYETFEFITILLAMYLHLIDLIACLSQYVTRVLTFITLYMASVLLNVISEMKCI